MTMSFTRWSMFLNLLPNYNERLHQRCCHLFYEIEVGYYAKKAMNQIQAVSKDETAEIYKKIYMSDMIK